MVERLARGRFRVKSGVDEATARRVAARLEELGAVCTVTARDRPSAAAAAPREAEVSPADNGPAAGLAGAAPPGPVRKEPESALAGAESGGGLDLGALAGGGAGLSLSSVDGTDEPEPPAAPEPSAGDAFAPPHDPFAPPEAQGGPPELELAAPVAQPAPAAQPVAEDAPPEGGLPAEPAPAPASPAAAPSAGETATLRAAPAPRAGPIRGALIGAAEGGRAWFVAGVVVAAAVGFVVAHVFASVRESSAYADSREIVDREQARVDDLASWRALDDVRSTQLERMRSTRLGIALTSALVWAVVAGGIALVWFRLLDWSAVARRLRPPNV